MPFVAKGWFLSLVVFAAFVSTTSDASGQTGCQDLPHGSSNDAVTYYTNLAITLAFHEPATIIQASSIDDVPVYLGYVGLSAADLEHLPSDVLMHETNGTVAPGDILASRFFAPKIINVNDPPATRGLGWRKLVRLRAHAGSQADKHNINSAIILFNFFTGPGIKPFANDAESGNTQVILTSLSPNMDSIYWLDFDKSGKLSLKLDQSFDAGSFVPNTVPAGPSGIQSYFVPEGCVGCHGGENKHKALVNYLDTDNWYDRVDNDFARLRTEGSFVLFDANTDDPNSRDYHRAFDVFRQFNKEAEAHAAVTQPQAFHRAATLRWLDLHTNSDDHFPPISRGIPGTNVWSLQAPNDAEAIGLLNRYCFRCHGTIKFNVFDKGAVKDVVPKIRERLQPLPDQLRFNPCFRMPVDRRMDDADLKRLLEILP